MSLHVEEASRRLETISATLSLHQPPSVEAAHPAEFSDSSTNPHRGSRLSNREVDYWISLLGQDTIAKFKDLAHDFEKQDSVDDVVNWDQHLLKQLGHQFLVDQYNVWSQEYFTPRTRITTRDLLSTFLRLDFCLRQVNWNVSNQYTEAVSLGMIYGRRLDNDGRFSLGRFRSFWLILQLNMWAIYPQDDMHQRRGLADGQPGGVLGLRYKLLGEESTKASLLFFPLGHILFAEALGSDMISNEDAEKCVNEAEWTKTPYVLAVGVREDGSTEQQFSRAKYYAIHNPAHKMQLHPVPTEDSDDDDDVQDNYFYQEPPAFTVARVSKQSTKFLSRDVSSVVRAGELEFERLSTSATEIIETTMSERMGAPNEYVRFGLFAE